MSLVLIRFKGMFLHSKKLKTVFGFSLIEILVAISLFSVILVIVIPRTRVPQNRITADDVAYNIALSIRQAQNYSTSVLGTKTTGNLDTFNTGYGVHFDRTKPDYIIFSDQNVDHSYSPTQDLVADFLSLKGATIDLCRKVGAGGAECNRPVLTISFVRPNPEAFFKDNTGASVSAAAIRITFAGVVRFVNVNKFGQIVVGNVLAL